jgi:biotin carboxyl carrier protein
MSAEVIPARVEVERDGTARVLAPRVGWWSHLPPAGALLGPGSRIGLLSQLNRRFLMVLPNDAAGGIADGVPKQRALAVEYGQMLFKMEPVGEVAIGAGRQARESGGVSSGSALSEGTRAIVSPTDGVFYRKPSPDAAPFVEPGSRIRRGQPVGLVEVMKTFNQILYDGPGCPEEAEVVEVRCEDAQEVSAGQVLMLVR